MTEGSRPAVRSAAFPRPLTSLIGRENDLETISGLLSQHRLVTLIGSGGCGKTRLAMEAGHKLETMFENGGVFVDLAPIDSEDLVPSVVAGTVGVPEKGSAPLIDTVALALRDRNLLMVVDNCERVVDACAELVHSLLMGCPQLVVLATSRTPLGVDGELTWRVPSLSLPGQEKSHPLEALEASDAGRLLVERAQLQVANGAASSVDAQALVDICVKLDGIPLALEMAATRIRALGAEEVSRGLKHRFSLLSSGSRLVPPRQRTLEASIDWSFGLLAEQEQVLFRRLAVFAGRFDIDDVEAVCTGSGLEILDVRALLAALVDQSLVSAEPGSSHARYRLAETPRQYAHDRLVGSGEDNEFRNRHLDHLVAIASGVELVAEGMELEQAIAEIEPLIDEVRAALDCSIRVGRVADGLRLAAMLRPLWIFRNRNQEGREWLNRLLAADDSSDPEARVSALLAAAHLCLYAGDPTGQQALASEALEVARKQDDRRLEGRSLLFSAWPNVFLDPDRARALFTSARDAAVENDNAREFENASWGLGWTAATTGRLEEGCQAFDAGIAKARTRDSLGLRYGLTMRGYVAILHAEFSRADEMLHEAASLFSEGADRFNADRVTTWQGVSAMHQGRYDQAMELLQAAVASAEEVGNPPMFAPLHLGLLHRAVGDAGRAHAVIEQARPELAELGRPWWFEAQALVALADAAPDPDHARGLLGEARAVAEESGNPLALTVACLGMARHAARAGDTDTAQARGRQGLAAAVSAGYQVGVIDALEALAVLPGLDQTVLLAAVDAERIRSGYARFPIDEPAYRAAVQDGDRKLDAAPISIEEAVALAMGDESGAARPASGWASLTPAELRVAELVADGLTNPEVGEKLFISRRTVQAHLSHIYAKLDVSNRAELATLVARHQESR